MNSSPPRVFISATTGDLRKIRGIARDALLTMGCLPVVQDHFAPDYREIAAMLGARIGECDAMIHIAGMRYGAEPDPASLPAGTPRRSYTQMELFLARELKLEKIYTFVCPEDFPYEKTTETGDPLPIEPKELRELQIAHREFLLAQPELRYLVDSPDELAFRIREIQLELEQIRGAARQMARRALWVGAVIAVALALLTFGSLWIIKSTGEVKTAQRELRERIGIQENAPRVLSAYQNRFREIREEVSRDRSVTVSNSLIDRMVREELPDMLDLDRATVTSILEIETPRIAADQGTPINLKLAALFTMGEYDAALEHGKVLLEQPAIDGLRTMGDSALAKYETSPDAGLYRDAIRYYRGAQALVDREQKPEEWISVTMSLAFSLLESGNYTEAVKLFEQLLDFSDSLLGGSIEEEALLMCNHSVALVMAGLYAEAEEVAEGALQTVESLPSKNPEILAAILSNFARIHADTGRIDSAKVYVRRVIEQRKSGGESDRIKLLIAENNLGFLTWAAGDHEEAEILLRRVMGEFESLLGKKHPMTLNALNTLGRCLRDQEELDEAEVVFRCCLSERETSLGERHPDTIATVCDLAGTLQRLGEIEEAEKLYGDALRMRTEVLGPDHRYTVLTMLDLAKLKEEKKEIAGVGQLYRSALEVRRRVLGEKHPDTASLIMDLGLLLGKSGSLEEAGVLLREGLDLRTEILGPEHPDTLQSMNDLAILKIFSDKDEEAEELLLDTLRLRMRVLGLQHPDTVVSGQNLARFLDETGRSGELEKIINEMTRDLE